LVDSANKFAVELEGFWSDGVEKEEGAPIDQPAPPPGLEIRRAGKLESCVSAIDGVVLL
jgi:hypothetical protein